VRLLFHVSLLDVRHSGAAITEVQLLTKAGLVRCAPRVVVDASGDLDLLARAGCAFLPLDEGEVMQPATAMFRFGPVDFATFDAIPPEQLKVLAARGVAEGALARAALHASRVEGTADALFNIGRLALDASDPLALSAAEVEGRRHSLGAAGFLPRHVPGLRAGPADRFRAADGQPPVPDHRQGRGKADEGHRDRAGDQVWHQHALAAVGHRLDLHAGPLLERLERQAGERPPSRCSPQRPPPAGRAPPPPARRRP
jgi:hypothetical protein